MYTLYAVTRNGRTLGTFPTLDRATFFLYGIIGMSWGFTEYRTSGGHSARFYSHGLSLITIEY